jgi:hypothetical protein
MEISYFFVCCVVAPSFRPSVLPSLVHMTAESWNKNWQINFEPFLCGEKDIPQISS